MNLAQVLIVWPFVFQILSNYCIFFQNLFETPCDLNLFWLEMVKASIFVIVFQFYFCWFRRQNWEKAPKNRQKGIIIVGRNSDTLTIVCCMLCCLLLRQWSDYSAVCLYYKRPCQVLLTWGFTKGYTNRA